MKKIRARLTYANVMSSIAIFLVIGGGAAFAANKLAKNSVGAKQLKKNSVTTAKLKKNSVTTAKLKGNAVTSAKIKGGAVTNAKIGLDAVTGDKVNEATLGTVPNSASTEVIKRSRGTLAVGQQATAFEYGPVRVIVRCETFEATRITARGFIESSADGTTFVSWEDDNRSIGPATPETERELTHPNWADSSGPMEAEPSAPVTVTTAAGASFAGTLGIASEKASNTCWYWFRATIIS